MGVSESRLTAKLNIGYGDTPWEVSGVTPERLRGKRSGGYEGTSGEVYRKPQQHTTRLMSGEKQPRDYFSLMNILMGVPEKSQCVRI